MDDEMYIFEKRGNSECEDERMVFWFIVSFVDRGLFDKAMKIVLSEKRKGYGIDTVELSCL